jgi:hypothetical protein
MLKIMSENSFIRQREEEASRFSSFSEKGEKKSENKLTRFLFHA